MGGQTPAQERPRSDYPLRAPKPVGQMISNIYRDRINQFYSGGQYEHQTLRSMMNEAVVSGEPHVQLSVWHAPGQTRPTFKDAVSQVFNRVTVGEWFGPSWTTHWFKVVLKVPAELRDKRLLEFHWDSNSEGLVWNEHGHPLQGLTGGGERVEWILPDSFRDGKEHTIYIEMACNGMFGNGSGDSIQPPDPNRWFRLDKAEIVAVDPDARQLYIDIWIIGDAAREFPQDSWEQHKALKVCNEIIDTFELGNRESLKACRKLAEDYIGHHVNSAKVYDSGKEPLVFGIGHCHIDSCWLWPFAETKRKVARSWSSQCDLMDRYPEYNFACSQAQQYKWLKELYPSAFDRVKKKVAEGRFHPIGGSWVEHDTNMPSGESLVRQFLYGQRFFESNFGKRCQTFWLPDTFGYSSQLPQLCRLSGMTRFLTQKLSWNNINRFPHTTFNWVALDGSQVICHMPPSETYTAEAHFGDVKRSMSQHKSLDQDATSLLVFGKGDGGGGPTWQHLEKLRRCRGISDTVGLLPRVHMGNSVDDFFDRLERKAASFVTWYGELYFELHRGTYTTQSNNKRNNRRAEVTLRDLELLATIASIKDKSYTYPKKDLDAMWETVLLCQFHDCLPGSSIEMVYRDSDEMYAEVFKTAHRLFKDIMKVLGVAEVQSTTVADGIALNTLPWHRKEVVAISEHDAAVACGNGPLLKLRTLKTSGDEPLVSLDQVSKGVFVLANEQLKVKVEAGTITSLYDKLAERELIPKGHKANQYVIFDDKPLYWQAWDVEVYHLDTRKPLPSSETQVHEIKSHRVSVVTHTKISDASSIKTIISLSAALPGQQSYVEISSEVEWHETMKFLKVEFPVDIRNTEASYETQFGIVKRPTHYNTTWDMAKFEVCSHRFADLSEHGYGVSILNDSKYGFATAGNVMRLSLLRSPKAPDAHADMGTHHIRWAILPHRGALSHVTVRKAFEFNNPIKLLSAPAAALQQFTQPPVHLTEDSSPALVLDTVKRGEDDEDISTGELPAKPGRSVVLRIYDSLGGRARGTVATTWPVKRVWKVNLLEDELEEVVFRDGRFAVDLRPFEVASFKLELA
ncbi:12772663-f14d-487e-9a98-def02d04d28d [Thermothielavioides terrestris]|uniref:Alpha-mannosidase n=2 Tax=Thermothielavioides terrestris TaxID=2587410 RepID=G2R4A3_THETT|nr:glycoside hydrolase family 38 protein [Thermothielavioides terrestris NRRL 8126]AEO66050.1 glycoside hydrolase family 38 protein [Thermothielavioides terrestris NRRL 8126]SPQ18689.1 12772663-f14d-487e-9a98-def02d04d28d [Thermothielavioides terrestris]